MHVVLVVVAMELQAVRTVDGHLYILEAYVGLVQRVILNGH